jgi:NAD+ diphosphatase
MTDYINKNTQFYFIIQVKEGLILTKNNTFPQRSDIFILENYFARSFALGNFNGIEYLCAEIKDDVTLNDNLHAIALRQVLSIIAPEQFAVCVKAYSVLNWDKNHQFCGLCAAHTIHKLPNFERFCQSCNISFFPRISPSIIVLIHRNSEF